jgi:RNA-directed DNA polymerase
MKEPHIEGLATHDDPESCVGAREGAGEALTGARAGRVLSRVITFIRSADAVQTCGRRYGQDRQREGLAGSARSETPSTYGTSLRENREIPGPPVVMEPRAASGRPEAIRR